jgi:hypothetical protein
MSNDQIFFLSNGDVVIYHEKYYFTIHTKDTKRTKYKLYEKTIYVTQFDRYDKILTDCTLSADGTLCIVSAKTTININRMINTCCVFTSSIPVIGFVTGSLMVIGLGLGTLGFTFYTRHKCIRDNKKTYQKLLKTFEDANVFFMFPAPLRCLLSLF